MAVISTSRTVLLLMGLLVSSQLVAHSALSQTANSGSPVVIRMTDQEPMKFVPDQVTVKVGQPVEWINHTESGGPVHSVTTDPDKVMDPRHVSIPKGAKPFDSGTIKPGKSFVHAFTVPGVYRYACPPHEGSMLGEITVEP